MVSLVHRYPLQQEVNDAVDHVLGSNEDFGEISAFDLDYAIIERIEDIISRALKLYAGTDVLNATTRKYKWTPLHVAVICDNVAAVRALVAAKVDLDRRDSKGWTPLQHAALLGRTRCITHLICANAGVSVENQLGGNYRDIVRCLAPVQRADSTPIKIVGEEGQTLTFGDFKRLTGATYLRETHLTPELMFEQWEHTPKPHEYPFVENYAREYRNFCLLPPTHQLKKVTCDSGNKPLTFSPGLGLFATDDIFKGILIGEYKGLFSKNSQPNEYSLADDDGTGVDAQNYRNEFALANDGFPNIVLVPARGIGGLSTRDLFVAADPIERGEQLCWNYGFLPLLKWMRPYVELRPEEMREFISTDDLKYLVQCSRKVGQRTCSFDEFVIGEKFRYIVQTPSAVFLMIFDKILTPEEVEEFIICDEMSEPYKQLLEVARSCLKMKAKLLESIPYAQWIRSLPARAGIAFTLEAAKRANQLLTKFSTKPKKELLALWNRFTSVQQSEIEKHVAAVTNPVR